MSDTVDQDAPEAQADIKSLVRAAYDAQHEPDDAPEPKSKEVAPESVEAPEEPEAKTERARGPDGKFVKADAEPAAQEPAKAADPAEQQPKTEEAAPSKEPPQHWMAADKQMFKSIPPVAQDFVLRRVRDMEADYTRKTQQVAELRRDYEPVQQLFAPYGEALRQKGLTPATLIKAWHDVEKMLVDGHGDVVIKNLVSGYRIPVERIAEALGIRQQAPAAVGGDQPPPAPAAPQAVIPPELMQEIQAHRNWINESARRQEYEARQRTYEAAARVENDINTFKSATDSAGNLLHPHYADVEHDMAALVHAYRASGNPIPPLSELYDRAVWSNPSTRALLTQQQTAAVTAQRQAAEEAKRTEVRAKAERARRAGSSVTGAPGGAPQSTGRSSADSIRGQLRAAYDEAMA